MDLNRSQRCQVRNKFESLQLTKQPTANHTELKFVEDWSPPETKMLPRQQKVDSIHGNPSCCLNSKTVDNIERVTQVAASTTKVDSTNFQEPVSIQW